MRSWLAHAGSAAVRQPDIVLGADIKEGIILVNSLHTTCALFVNEFQGALAEDLKTMMDRLVADGAGYKHDDPRFSDCERGGGHQRRRALAGPLPVDPVRGAGRATAAQHRHSDHGSRAGHRELAGSAWAPPFRAGARILV